MTIYLYSGTPGSGKSLHTADVIQKRLRYGKPVIANFEINFDKVKHPEQFFYIDNFHLNPANLEKAAINYFKLKPFKEGTLLLVIDECQMLFNSREWQSKDRMSWLRFFTQHRKLGFDIILVAQFDRMLDRQIRSLIEYECVHRKIKNAGAFGFILGMFFNLFVCVRIWYPMKQKIGSDWFRFKKRNADLYDSYKMFDVRSEESEMGCEKALSDSKGSK